MPKTLDEMKYSLSAEELADVYQRVDIIVRTSVMWEGQLKIRLDWKDDEWENGLYLGNIYIGRVIHYIVDGGIWSAELMTSFDEFETVGKYETKEEAKKALMTFALNELVRVSNE